MSGEVPEVAATLSALQPTSRRFKVLLYNRNLNRQMHYLMNIYHRLSTNSSDRLDVI